MTTTSCKPWGAKERRLLDYGPTQVGLMLVTMLASDTEDRAHSEREHLISTPWAAQ
jgi:hypothetical protein